MASRALWRFGIFAVGLQTAIKLNQVKLTTVGPTLVIIIAIPGALLFAAQLIALYILLRHRSSSITTFRFSHI